MTSGRAFRSAGNRTRDGRPESFGSTDFRTPHGVPASSGNASAGARGARGCGTTLRRRTRDRFHEHPRERRRRRPDGSQPECATSCRAVKGKLRKGGARASARAPELAKQRTCKAPETAPRNARLRPGTTGSHDGVARGLRSGHPRSGPWTRAPRERSPATFGFGRTRTVIAARAVRGLRFEHSSP